MILQAIELNRKTGEGKYDDAINVAIYQSRGKLGTAPNALWVMVQESPTFKATLNDPKFKAWLEKQRSEATAA